MTIGEIDGILPGAIFATRRQLYDAGMHRALMNGIVGTPPGGAESITVSGGYVDDEDLGDEIIYTGDGGRNSDTGRQKANQEFTGHNEALAISCLQGLPVRVVRGSKDNSDHSPKTGYRYEGLYRVESYWHERGIDGFLVCRFKLIALTSAQSQQSNSTGQGASGSAPRVSSTVLRIVRDTAVSRQVKALHKFQCQVCGIRLECEGGPYAEAAHIRALGSPHNGPDIIENVLCLCPNHHVLFDNGAISIDDDFSLIGYEGQLRKTSAHKIEKSYLQYQRKIWGRQ
jgi:putative restriction endonuclease